MQTCSKNVLTGPLTGDSKRSNISSIAKESVPLPPVALALPLEPASATGPPSPARGSAGMAPPPSPAGATYQPPTTPKQETPEFQDLKPAEKRRKARVGKAMVRNNIASNLHQNTMLLMCNPNNQNTYLNTVKREVESPKEMELQKKECTILNLASKIEPEISESVSEVFNRTHETKITEEPALEVVQQQVHCLKTEGKEPSISLGAEQKQIETESLQPCVKTVAENVKVKNMKRKLSVTSDAKTETEPAVPAKKQLLQTSPNANGSYKDLIKKSSTSIKINNGKRKLVEAQRNQRIRARIARLKRTTKRKLSPSKEEIVSTKRAKASKPLTASNLHNSKQNSKESKDKYIDSELIENKEPIKKNYKKSHVNSSKTSKKLAPVALDTLIAKNSVDRTNDGVVCEPVTRTARSDDPSALKTVEKCKVKTEVKKESVTNNKKSTNSKTVAVKSSKVECRKIGNYKRKGKNCPEVVTQVISKVPRKSLHLPRWSNGWTWEGEPYEAKVFLNVSNFYIFS